jgi:hypothetical protein
MSIKVAMNGLLFIDVIVPFYYPVLAKQFCR